MIHRTALLILCPFALLSLSSSLHGQGKTARPELSIQHGHYASVADVCYSPDGKLIATSAKRVILWDAQTGRQIRILPVSALEPDVLQFSPDGKYLAVAPGVYMVNGTITLWEVATGKKVLTTKLCSGHAKVRFSPDGSQFISTYQGGVAVWSTATGREMHYLFSRHSNASIPFVSTLIYTSDGKHIVALYSDHFLTVWNAQSGKKLQSFRSPVRGEASCDLSPAGKHLVIRREKTVEIRESRTFKLISTFKADPVFSTASFTPDGARVAIQNSSHAISIRSTATGKEAMRLKSLNGFLISSFSPDGKRIVTSANGKEVLVWDVLTGKRLLQLASPADWLQVMALSPDGKLLATGSDTCVQIRDAVTLVPRRIYKAHTAPISDLCFSPDGRRLATSSSDGTVRISRIDGKPIHVFKGHFGYATPLCFSPDGKHLFTGSRNRAILVWDVRTGRALRALTGHTHEVQSISYSPGGKYIATGAHDSVIIWNAKTEKPIHRIRQRHGLSGPYGVERMRFSSDSRSLLVLKRGFAGFLERVNVLTGKVTHLIEPLGRMNTIRDFDIDPNEKTIATALDTGVVLWDLKTGRKLRSFRDSETAFSVRFSSNGKRLITRGRIPSLQIWEVSTGKEIVRTHSFHEGKNQVSVTPEGYLTGTPDALKLLSWKVKGKHVPFARYQRLYHRPDKVAQALKGN